MLERLVVFVQDNFYRYKYFILYGVIGVVSALLDFVVFNRMVALTECSYIVANIVSVHCGVISSFTLNRQFNFKVKDQPIKRFFTFYIVAMIGLLISSIILVQLIEKVGLDTKPAKAIAILIAAVFQFTLNKTITFKRKEAIL
jgi:putative flippase GtrA